MSGQPESIVQVLLDAADRTPEKLCLLFHGTHIHEDRMKPGGAKAAPGYHVGGRAEAYPLDSLWGH